MGMKYNMSSAIIEVKCVAGKGQGIRWKQFKSCHIKHLLFSHI